MIDTGASHIVLALQDARKLGYRRGNLDFSQEFQSANGTVRAAPVELRELRVGQLQLYDLEASVNGWPLADLAARHELSAAAEKLRGHPRPPGPALVASIPSGPLRSLRWPCSF